MNTTQHYAEYHGDTWLIQWRELGASDIFAVPLELHACTPYDFHETLSRFGV